MQVKDAKPIVDTKPPKTYMHLHLKLKKIQMEEERQAIADRDNRILLEKMAHTMKTKGLVDNRNDYKHRRYVLYTDAVHSTDWLMLCGKKMSKSYFCACVKCLHMPVCMKLYVCLYNNYTAFVCIV